MVYLSVLYVGAILAVTSRRTHLRGDPLHPEMVVTMSELDDALKDVYRSDQIQASRDAARAGYEEKIVKKILTAANLGTEIRDMAMDMQTRVGKARVTLAAFYESYPDFPVQLTARKLPFVYQVSFKDIFNKFCSTPIFKTWDEYRDECASDKPIGLVFDWPGVSGTQMIIHNDTVLSDANNQVRLTRLIGNPLNPNSFVITVEQFEGYLQNIIRRWARAQIDASDDTGTVPQNS